MISKENTSAISELVLLTVCALTNEIGSYKREHFHEGEWPKEGLDFFQKLKSNWRLYHASHWDLGADVKPIGLDHDYQGVILINHEQKQIILAHRGLQLKSVANLVSGLVIGTNRCPEIAKSAMALCDIALQYAEENQYQLIHTGFSMGGYLSQITGAYANHKHPGSGTVVCFEAVGATPAIKVCGFKDNRENTVNYVTAPNIVNTCNEHYGYVRQIDEFKGHNFYLKDQIKPKIVDATLTLNLDDIDSETAELFEGLLWLTICYHRQEVLLGAIKDAESFQFLPIHGWPISKINLEKVAAKELPTLEKVAGSYGMILSNIIQNSNVIRNLAGYEGCNTLSYNLQCTEVIYGSEPSQEVICGVSSVMSPRNPYADQVDNNKDAHAPYDPCALM